MAILWKLHNYVSYPQPETIRDIFSYLNDLTSSGWQEDRSVTVKVNVK